MKTSIQPQADNKQQFPESVRVKSSITTIYRVNNRDKARFEVRYHDTNGVRQRQTFEAYALAKEHALTVAENLAKGGADMIVLRGKDRFAYERAMDIVLPLGRQLDTFVADHAEIIKSLEGIGTPLEAVQYYRKHRPKNLPSVAVKTVVAEFIESRKEDDCGRLYLRDLRIRLGQLAKMFNGPISQLTPHDFDLFLKTIGKSRRTRFNVRGNVQTLINFAKERGYIAADFPGLFKVSKKKRKFARVVKIFTPDEMQTLLDHAKPQVAVCLAITAFAGIRAEELKRLDCGHIHLREGHIEVPARLAKNGIRRLPPITPNHRAFLEHYLPASGPVCSYKNLVNQYLKLAKRAGVKWKRNALRHSFVSYRVADINNIPQVAIESGHTVNELQSDYLKVVDKPAASAWFGILPKATGPEAARSTAAVESMASLVADAA